MRLERSNATILSANAPRARGFRSVGPPTGEPSLRNSFSKFPFLRKSFSELFFIPLETQKPYVFDLLFVYV